MYIYWLFQINDTQASPPIKKSRFFFPQKVAYCSETNEESIFRFYANLIFEIWLLKILRIVCKTSVPKDAQCSETDHLIHEFLF